MIFEDLFHSKGQYAENTTVSGWAKRTHPVQVRQNQGDKMSKIRKSAKGQECQVRFPGVCNCNPETTVLAHINGAGVAKKSLDIFGAYACYDCHKLIDRLPSVNHVVEFDDAMRIIQFYEAVWRTQKIMLEQGLIKI